MRGAWGLLVVAACASKPPYASDIEWAKRYRPEPNRVDEPRSLAPRPWRVGQWAKYKSRLRREIVLDLYRVVAIDSCGIWVKRTTETAQHRWQWLFCFHEGAQVSHPVLERIVATVDDQRPQNGGPAGEIAAAISVMVPADWLARSAIAREDVDVVGGHFAGAVRARSSWEGHDATKLTVWAHPEVPFGGVLKVMSDDASYEQDLIEYGDDSAASSFVLELATEHANVEAKPLKPYLELGDAWAWLTRHGTADSSFELALRGGFPLSAQLDAMFVIDTFASGSSATDPSLMVESFSARAGARWSWKHGADDFLRFYLQGTLGYAELDKTMGLQDAGAAHGIALGMAAGLTEKIAHDWGLFGELADTVGYYDAGEGIRHLLSVMVGLELHWP